jgi:hypothetical protein
METNESDFYPLYKTEKRTRIGNKQEGSVRDKVLEPEAVPTGDVMPCICTQLAAISHFYEPYNDFPGTTFM